MASYHWKVSRNWVPVRLYVPPSIYGQLLEVAKEPYKYQGTELEQINQVIHRALQVWLEQRVRLEEEEAREFSERARIQNGIGE